MLVNSRQLFKEAQKKKFAIPATNFISLNMARVFVQVAEKRKLPLILPFAQSHREFIPLKEAALIGKYFAEKASVPIVLHLDHGEDIDFIKKAIQLGFSSVMIDASQKPFEENIAITKEVVEYAHKYDVTVEAELGHVGANENFEAHEVIDSVYTDAKDVELFVKETNVDSLAVSIGTAHGVYVGTPKISFDTLKEITAITDIPLVLHGGSSTGDDNLKQCAINGMTKINIFTDFLNGAYEAIQSQKPTNFLDLIQLSDKAMEEVLHHYYDVFQTQAVDIKKEGSHE